MDSSKYGGSDVGPAGTKRLRRHPRARAVGVGIASSNVRVQNNGSSGLVPDFRAQNAIKRAGRWGGVGAQITVEWIRLGTPGAQNAVEWIPRSANRRRVDSPFVHSSHFCAPNRPSRGTFALRHPCQSSTRAAFALRHPCQSSTRAAFALRRSLSQRFCAGCHHKFRRAVLTDSLAGG